MSEFANDMARKGWHLVPGFINPPLVNRMLKDLEKAYLFCRNIQIRNGVENSEGTCHHLVGLGASFMNCLVQFERLNLEEYFGGKYILNSFGGNLLRSRMSYASEIHRDQRSFSGELPLMLNTLVMLDDFTEENGATWLMNTGHAWFGKPTEAEFKAFSFQVTGKAGSVAVWNSNLWHKAGENKTYKPRRSVTPMFSRPFFKQGYDYTQFVEDDTPEYLKQILGYYSRTPQSLNDWYQQPNERFYRSDQG